MSVLPQTFLPIIIIIIIIIIPIVIIILIGIIIIIIIIFIIIASSSSSLSHIHPQHLVSDDKSLCFHCLTVVMHAHYCVHALTDLVFHSFHGLHMPYSAPLSAYYVQYRCSRSSNHSLIPLLIACTIPAIPLQLVVLVRSARITMTLFCCRYSLRRLPPYVICVVKRFRNNNFFVEKNPTIVTFPLKGWGLRTLHSCECNEATRIAQDWISGITFIQTVSPPTPKRSMCSCHVRFNNLAALRRSTFCTIRETYAH